MIDEEQAVWPLIAVVLAHLVGAALALRAARRARTPQGAVAWCMALLAAPFISAPLYAIFGPGRFAGDVEGWRLARRTALAHLDAAPLRAEDGGGGRGAARRGFERLAQTPILGGNRVELLCDGAVFEAGFAAIEAAERHVLAQFYIIRDDGLGRAFRDRLAARAEAGIDVFLLYDDVGCHNLPAAYLAKLEEAGARVCGFSSRRGLLGRLQLNFRNHRKLLSADGATAIIGGPNVGDEYLGLSPRFGSWRDTALLIEGPAAAAAELVFAQDWAWAAGRAPDLDWRAPRAQPGGAPTLILPSGPADEIETCSLFFCHAIGVAERRIWIASPYFVPDTDVMTALKLAALRGVEVRVLIPARPDHRIVWLAAFAFLDEARAAGVEIWRYEAGFMHQKALVIDDWAAAVGSANLDNRSFRLNFELTALVFDPRLVAEAAAMLEADFARSSPYAPERGLGPGRAARFLSPIARLAAPLL